MNTYKKTPDSPENKRFLEVFDEQNCPLAILSKDVVHRQLLKHRSIQVLVFNTEKKIYLQKRNNNKRFFPGRWDVSARTHPKVGESTFTAAMRVLKDELQLEIDHPQFVHALPACPETSFEHVTIYSVIKNTQPITPNLNEVSEGYYFSREELTCLIKEFRELLTPNLVTLWEAGLLTQG